MKNILSVDWDYFFPDISSFDWQMNEDNTIFYEFIWYVRYWNRNLFTKFPAHEVFNPDPILLHAFWPELLKKTIDPLIIITDAHKDIEILFDHYTEKVNVWNFDQHHDCGYAEVEEDQTLHSGNWAEKFFDEIGSYFLFYPSWRTTKKEPYDISANVFYQLPQNPPLFDAIFVCRSSCWTPSWCDDSWLWFIDQLEKRFPDNYKNGIKNKYVLKPREFRISIRDQFKPNV